MTSTLLLAWVLGAPALKEKPEPTLVGQWAVQSVTVNAQASQPGTDRWDFNPDGTCAFFSQGKPSPAVTYTRDPKAGTLDLLPAAGGAPTHLCRYRVDGNTLILCVGHDHKVRPADLEPAPKATVWVFKRIAKKD